MRKCLQNQVWCVTSPSLPFLRRPLWCSLKMKVKWSHRLLTGRSCEVMLVSSKSCGAQGWISKISRPDWSQGIVTCKKSVETLTSDDMLNFDSERKFLCSSFPPCLQEAARGPILKSMNSLLPPVANAFLWWMPSSLLRWTPSSFPQQVTSSLNRWTPHSTNSRLTQRTAWVLSLIEWSCYSMNGLVAQRMLSLLNERSLPLYIR